MQGPFVVTKSGDIKVVKGKPRPVPARRLGIDRQPYAIVWESSPSVRPPKRQMARWCTARIAAKNLEDLCVVLIFSDLYFKALGNDRSALNRAFRILSRIGLEYAFDGDELHAEVFEFTFRNGCD